MTGETEKDVSGWTVDTLKSHFESLLRETDLRYQQRFDDQSKAITAALASQKEYSGVVEENNKLWRAAANEWRDAMNDREKNFASVGALQSLADRVDKAEKKQDQTEGSDSGRKGKVLDQRATVGVIVGLASVLLVIIIFLINIYTSKPR